MSFEFILCESSHNFQMFKSCSNDPSSVRVFINTATIIFPDPNSEIRSVINIYVHPGYGPSPSGLFRVKISSHCTNPGKHHSSWLICPQQNDIAVVRLNSPVRAVPRVHLTFDYLFAGDTALTYGFGYSGSEGVQSAQLQKLDSLNPSARQHYPSNFLRKATTVILSSSDCFSAYLGLSNELLTDDQYICVRTVNQLCEVTFHLYSNQ